MLGRFARDDRDLAPVARAFAEGPVEVAPFRRADAALAASLIPATRRLGLGLGDRACLALALSRGLPVLTTDRAWTRLPFEVDIRILR